MIAQNKFTSLLFNPSVYLAGAPALWLGLAAILLAATHRLARQYSFRRRAGRPHRHAGPALDIFARRNFRLAVPQPRAAGSRQNHFANRVPHRGCLGTQALARWPMVLLSIVLLPKSFQRISNDVIHTSTPAELPENESVRCLPLFYHRGGRRRSGLLDARLDVPRLQRLLQRKGCQSRLAPSLSAYSSPKSFPKFASAWCSGTRVGQPRLGGAVTRPTARGGFCVGPTRHSRGFNQPRRSIC